MVRDTYPVVIVGAGPYGLACAAHLRAARVDLRVFGTAMEFWNHHMPVGMLLRSSREASHISAPYNALSLDRYEAHRGARLGTPIARADFLAYGQWFQHQVVPDLDRRRVAHVDIDDGRDAGRAPGRDDVGYRLALDDGEVVRASRVVLATGLDGFSYRPPQFAALPAELASHSADHGDLGRFAGRSVAVVGGGQSALESAALLAEGGARVEVVVRAPRIRWLGRTRAVRESDVLRRLAYHRTDVGPAGLSYVVAFPGLFRHLPADLRRRIDVRSIRPAGAAWLRPRIQGVRLTIGRAVASARPSGGRVALTLDDGGERLVDHVLLATGYRVDVSRYPFLAPELAGAIRRVDGYPVLGAGFEASVPGLHVVGAPAAWTFGPVMRFVSGTEYTARELTRYVIAAAAGGANRRAWAHDRSRLSSAR